MSRSRQAKRLNVFDATLIVMGCIVASGIFMNPSVVAQRLHSTGLILFAWLLGGVVALIGAFVFAELASRRPDVGGMYGYLRDAYHPVLAFMSGWTALLVSQSGAIAAVAVTFATYAHLWIPLNVPELAVAAIVVTSFINCLGLREGVGTQNVLMLMKAGAIALIIAAGFFGPIAPAHHAAAAATASPGALAVLAMLGAALIPVFYSYDGWQTAPFLDGEMKHSARALPMGLVIGVIGVVVMYVAVTLGGLRMLGADGLAATSTPATDMVRLVIGRAGEGVVGAFIALSTLGYLQTATLAVPRLYYRMAKDGLFFKQLAYLHPKRQTPVVAIVLQCLVSIAIVGWGNYQRILNYVTPMDFLYMVLAAGAIWIFRRKDAMGPAPAIRIPGHPWSTVFFAGVSAAFVVNAYIAFPRDSVIGLVIFFSGVPIYLVWRRRAATTPVVAAAADAN
ncbi:MAG TPA: amino acid permease [Candidatus Baltobacteraceae bacterium]|nr:amino acid permease [Candidatus Baltobacteraceae bacterium]